MSAALVRRLQLGAQAAGVCPRGVPPLAGVRGATIPIVNLRLLVALRQHPLRRLGAESAAVLLEMTNGPHERLGSSEEA